MKKFILVLFAILTIMCFSACDNAPAIEKYYLDTSGNLIAEFEDGSTKDLGSLKNSKLAIDLLTKLHVDDRIKLVLNKFDSPKFVVENEAVRRMLGVDIISLIPHTNTITGNAINMGVPFIYSYPREPISDAVRELMSRVRYNCIVGGTKVEKK